MIVVDTLTDLYGHWFNKICEKAAGGKITLEFIPAPKEGKPAYIAKATISGLKYQGLHRHSFGEAWESLMWRIQMDNPGRV